MSRSLNPGDDKSTVFLITAQTKKSLRAMATSFIFQGAVGATVNLMGGYSVG